MRARSPRHWLTVLALVAWLANLCLPVAHAAVMAQHGGGGLAWCGPNSDALSAKLSLLPAEVRTAIQKQNEAQNQSIKCPHFCASATATGLPPVSVTVALRAAGLETPPLPVVVPVDHAYRPAPPPATGPPSRS